jgi:hypothetical protein
MDHTGVTPPVTLSAPDLADVVLGEGPFLTVYLATEASIENAARSSPMPICRANASWSSRTPAGSCTSRTSLTRRSATSDGGVRSR